MSTMDTQGTNGMPAATPGGVGSATPIPVAQMIPSGTASAQAKSDAIEAIEKDIRAKRRNVIIAIVLAVIVIAGIASFMLFTSGSFGPNDPAAQEGQAPYKTEEEMQAESEREIAQGMFNISIAADIEFENADAAGFAYIENVPNNPYDMQVVITEDETGDVLYESGTITPNHYIESITLSKQLEVGEHDATATFIALDPETGEEAGQAAAALNLDIKG